jgi:hypothetical protein
VVVVCPPAPSPVAAVELLPVPAWDDAEVAVLALARELADDSDDADDAADDALELMMDDACDESELSTALDAEAAVVAALSSPDVAAAELAIIHCQYAMLYSCSAHFSPSPAHLANTCLPAFVLERGKRRVKILWG